MNFYAVSIHWRTYQIGNLRSTKYLSILFLSPYTGEPIRLETSLLPGKWNCLRTVSIHWRTYQIGNQMLSMPRLFQKASLHTLENLLDWKHGYPPPRLHRRHCLHTLENLLDWKPQVRCMPKERGNVNKSPYTGEPIRLETRAWVESRNSSLCGLHTLENLLDWKQELGLRAVTLPCVVSIHWRTYQIGNRLLFALS